MEKATNYIALSIPIFFLLIGIELLVSRHQKKEYYRFNDSINDLSTGILQQLTGIFAKGAIFFGYFYIFEHWHLFDIPLNNPLTWVIGFLGVDCCYYWFHRLSHEINIIWGSHITHHQSEEYNLTVALRQSSIQNFFSAAFYWPLALIGLPPVPFLALSSFNTLYQFWIHTRAIDKMWGPIEAIFNTPSHHRVHHGCNPQYIDRNHAGTLIIWDRLFGTYEEEVDDVIYGVTKPLKSWNPVWANVHYFVELFNISRETSRLRDKFLIWIMPPHWRPADVPFEDIEKTPLKGIKYDARGSRKTNSYILVHFTIAISAMIALIFVSATLPWLHQIALAAFVTWTMINNGATFESPGWLMLSETFRLLYLALLPWQLTSELPQSSLYCAIISAAAAVSLFWWYSLRSDLQEVHERHLAEIT